MNKILSTFLIFTALILTSWTKDNGVATAPPFTLKIMTYNTHHCNPPEQPDVINTTAIASVIKQEQPDIVALQEIDVRTKRAGRIDELAEIAAKSGYAYSYFAKAMDYDGGQYGIAILSKFPLSQTQTHLLPMTANRGEEQRVFATATVHLPHNRNIKFGSTHLDFKTPSTQVKQITVIHNIAEKYTVPFFFAGDLNSTPESAAIQTLNSYFTKTCNKCSPTFHEEGYNSDAIDYIAFKPSKKITVLSHKVLTQYTSSDHYPVIAEIRME